MPYGLIWRRERDSNPRYAINVYTLSRRAPSATRTPLRISSRHFIRYQFVNPCYDKKGRVCLKNWQRIIRLRRPDCQPVNSFT